jgi:hypothetical protein
MDEQVDKRYDEPSRFVNWATFLKIGRATVTIALFSLNNGINDFFIGYFFLVTSLLGFTYLSMCGFEKPKDTGKK